MATQQIALVDYGSSNLHSVEKALITAAGHNANITTTGVAEVIAAADKVVFPGQGAIGKCMQRLRETGLDAALNEALREKPFLGICLGLQSLMETSEEDGGVSCLGAVPGHTVRLTPDATDPDTGLRLKIPHMGWNQVEWARPHALTAGIPSGERFYFVHSYMVQPGDPESVVGIADYGQRFCVALGTENIFAVQFHPEKSASAGLEILRNFVSWRP